MSTEKFFIADPYNDEHIKAFNQFESSNGINTKTGAYLKQTRQSLSKEKYDSLQKKQNEIEQSLFLQDDLVIKDSCHIKGEKDIKICTLFFAPLNFKSKNRKLLSLATDYAFNVLGMEEVFVSTAYDDKNLQDILINKGFENLGETEGNITFLKERENQKIPARVM